MTLRAIMTFFLSLIIQLRRDGRELKTWIFLSWSIFLRDSASKSFEENWFVNTLTLFFGVSISNHWRVINLAHWLVTSCWNVIQYTAIVATAVNSDFLYQTEKRTNFIIVNLNCARTSHSDEITFILKKKRPRGGYTWRISKGCLLPAPQSIEKYIIRFIDTT